MTALEIVSILLPFEEYVIRLQEAQAARLPKYEWDYSVSLSYTFITLKILRETKGDTSKDLYIQITFRIENDLIVFSELFHADENYIPQLTDKIRSDKRLNRISFEADIQQVMTYSDDTLKSLAIADRVSQPAVNMYTGDNYWPGNYSNVKLTSTAIVLEQVNHMNSRSINHKENYSLRSLIFQIPLQNTQELKQSFNDVLLGNMLISFSDHSSLNNLEAGDSIQKQLKKEF